MSEQQNKSSAAGGQSVFRGLVMPDHAEIYLVRDGDEWSWCDCPTPGYGMIKDDSIRYVRADSLQHVAFDRDECTVTIAFDNEQQVMDFVASHSSRNRVRIVDDEA